ncbi:Beta-cyclopiazonate dehydrogenase [Ceratocystis lukuohia]|uniref:Beta-cyclopiazonate dehydrogenase n=1 Tax=Ceratocystis lukuohia TaxID=2019550 RepID=A0ABR4MTZ7_9PEZI
MNVISSIVVFATTLVAASGAATGGLHTPVVTRDVLIVGGGATGTYAAINLTDAGYSVAVVESDTVLGGHVSTYVDPVSGRAADYGVIVLSDEPVVHNFLTRLNIGWVPTELDGSNISFFDFKTGKPNQDYVQPSPADAIPRYWDLLLKYPYLADDGIVLPDPVPDELLCDFGEIIEKYNLSGLSRVFFQWGQGFGDILKLPALYALKYFSQSFILGIKGENFISVSTGNFQDIYDNAAAVLGDSVYYQSRVTYMNRGRVDSEGYTRAVVSTPSGKVIIRAKKILMTIPPLLNDNYLNPFQPNSHESSLFSQFSHFNLWVAAIKDSSLPPINLQNVSPGINSTLYSLAKLPDAYYFRLTPAPGVWATAFGSLNDEEHTEDAVKGNILKILADLRENGGYANDSSSVPEAEIVEFRNHSPYELTVPVEAIRKGFYRDLYELQGYQNTYWTGAAWDAHDSSNLWKFTGRVLESLKLSLE